MAKVIDYIIVVSENATYNELRAATFVRDNIRLVCGKNLPIVKDSVLPCKYEIIVGETNREKIYGVEFQRYREPNTGGIWEFIIQSKETSLFLTGLGKEPENQLPYTSAYKHIDDGKIGTVMAAYRFVEDILGYDFLYSLYMDIPENPELEMPSNYHFCFTREALRIKQPILFDGAAIYVLNGTEELHVNTGGMIIKTRQGKIAVIDGGRPSETGRFISLLQRITGKQVPHVHLWLFSHLHIDHFGVYYNLCSDEKYCGSVTVGDFYCNLLTEEFYTKLGRERVTDANIIRSSILASYSMTGARVHTVTKGDIISLDEIEFEVIHVPDIAFADKMNMNDSSVIYKMTYDNKQTIMLLGDAEWVCSNDLVENCADKLKSDIVQVGHHGCGNVSEKCYELIDAEAYIWQTGEKFWYSDCGEGLNTHNTGIIRTRAYMMRKNPKKKNIHLALDEVFSSPLPMKIY